MEMSLKALEHPVITFVKTNHFDVAFMNRSHVIPGYWLAHVQYQLQAAINWLITMFC